ncbi:MAG TPA: endonuclease/exonuclease/phosphatase family protein [Polyangiaceae bacterium]
MVDVQSASTSQERARDAGIVVASHNTMHGVFLGDLIERYRALVPQHRVDVLCLQENVPLSAEQAALRANAGTHAELFSAELGEFQCVCLPEHPALATLIRKAFVLEDAFLVPLPRLERLNWLERLYIRGGKVTAKYALICVIGDDTQRLTIANFHLETAGDNAHRRRQIAAVASALRERGLLHNLVACGDTNAFSWSRSGAVQVIAELMQPLQALAGATPKTDGKATHYFARQREDLLPHRIACMVGRLGVDHPLPYDVICSDLEALKSGKVQTEESDHDLVYAELRWPQARTTG